MTIAALKRRRSIMASCPFRSILLTGDDRRRIQARFFVPTRASLTPARAGAVKVGRRATLAACTALARPHLDGFEHDGSLGAVGITIRGEPAGIMKISLSNGTRRVPFCSSEQHRAYELVSYAIRLQGEH